MRNVDPIVWYIVIITVVIIGGIALAASYSSSKTPTQYNVSEQSRPIMEISQKDFDLGTMKLADTKTVEIAIKNIGEKPLTISDFTTSCGCTLIQVFIGEEKSPEFSLHNKVTWQKDLEVGQSATLKVTYQPKLMPVEGKVERTAYFKTNDPTNTNVQINLTSFVEK